MKSFTDSERAAIARGWCRVPGTQRVYAAQHGVPARTLRSWVKKYGSQRRDASADLRGIVVDALEKLHAVLAALDAADAAGEHDDLHDEHGVGEAAQAAGVAGPERGSDADVRPDAPAPEEPSGAAPVHERARTSPTPMPPPGIVYG